MLQIARIFLRSQPTLTPPPGRGVRSRVGIASIPFSWWCIVMMGGWGAWKMERWGDGEMGSVYKN
ncbi:hypothetical protein [Okeania sp. KiyG1]|uniref:hypothetical protein n=1 Tax=Okeania sp. KiyG1 TaxID=2720165 RepID=UPI001923485D|nr:hypothetical protein [Okeania sp. KiyG1]